MAGNLVVIPTTFTRWILGTNSNNHANISSMDDIDFKCSTSNELFEWEYKNKSNGMISMDWYNLWVTMDTSVLMNSMDQSITSTYYNDILDIDCVIDYNSNDMANSPISITMNKSPKGGYCYYENYELICEGWNDIEQDYPLFYSFVLDNIHLSDMQINNRLSDVYLPQNANSVTVYIYDSYLAVTKYEFDVDPQNNINVHDNDWFMHEKDLNANAWIMALLADIDNSTSNDDISLNYWFNQTLQISDTHNWNLYMNDGSPIRYFEVISTLIALSQS